MTPVPANLTPQYLEAEERFKEASTPREKLEALEEMLRTIPKHKGTEKLQADIKRRLSAARKEIQKKRVTHTQKPVWQIDREGAGQVALCGPPNSGKSELFTRLSGVAAEVADYPFTTRLPQPGMMPFEDIQIQLVDLPPLAPESLEPWQLGLIQQSDVALLLFDVNDPHLLEQTEFVYKTFDERGLWSSEPKRPRTVILGNKVDKAQGSENFEAWMELYGHLFQAEPFAALSSEQCSSLRRRLFELLDVVRVYTRAPGEKPDPNATPFILRRGSTVLEAAAAIHKDLAQNFRFARIWGRTKFDGQMVERSHVLEDGDWLEVH